MQCLCEGAGLRDVAHGLVATWFDFVRPAQRAENIFLTRSYFKAL